MAVKNFHLPLPEKTYLYLRAEARRRAERKRDIAAFAAQGGHGLDIDRDLQAAAVEFLRENNDWH